MSVAVQIIVDQIAHEMGEHIRPRFRCPDCDSVLHAQRAIAKAEQGDLLGVCHDADPFHAWYHKHGSTWMRPAEAKGFA